MIRHSNTDYQATRPAVQSALYARYQAGGVWARLVDYLPSRNGWWLALEGMTLADSRYVWVRLDEDGTLQRSPSEYRTSTEAHAWPPAAPAPTLTPAEQAIEAAVVTQVNTVHEDELEGPDFAPRTVIEHPQGVSFADWKAHNLTPDWDNWHIGEGLDAGTHVFGYSAESPRRTVWVFVRPTF